MTYGMSRDQFNAIIKAFEEALWNRSGPQVQFALEAGPEWRMNRFLDELGGYACDHKPSNLQYPAAYEGLRPIEEQIEMVAARWKLAKTPALKLVKRGLPKHPSWAEGWGALPLFEAIKGTYWEKVEKALLWLNHECGSQDRDRYWSSGAPEGLKFDEHVEPYHQNNGLVEGLYDHRRNFVSTWQRTVKSKIVLVPVQMGLLRRGQSDRMVRAHCSVKGKSEFPLGALEVACLLAMHPQRVPAHSEKALGVNAPGDKYNQAARMISSNCDHNQMSTFTHSINQRHDIPSFSFARGGYMAADNGPITASAWTVREMFE